MKKRDGVTSTVSHVHVCGIEAALRGMRNPKHSWAKSDSLFDDNGVLVELGENDLALMRRLIKAGPSHRKFLRMIHIQFDMRGSLKFFDQLATYRFLTTNSTSQMHTLGERLLNENDFTVETDPRLIAIGNEAIVTWQQNKTPDNWRRMIDSIPQSFQYIRTVDMTAETFLAIMNGRSHHRLIEWRQMIDELLDANDILRVIKGLKEGD